jgi:hypothetical protein
MRLPRVRFTVRRRMAAVALAALVAGVVLRGAWLLWLEVALNPPRDRGVRALFTAHRADFETVREMILADSISAIQLSPDGPKAHLRQGIWVGLSNLRRTDLGQLGLTRPRIEEYLRRLRGMQVSRVDRGWGRPEGDVAFTVYAFGNVADSYTKRIVYSKMPPTPVRFDTDTPEFRRDNSIVYSEIGNGWYIEKERD